MIVNVFSNIGNTWDMDMCGFVTSMVVDGDELTEHDAITISREAIRHTKGGDVQFLTPHVIANQTDQYKLFETANVNINTDLNINYVVVFGQGVEEHRPYTLLIIT